MKTGVFSALVYAVCIFSGCGGTHVREGVDVLLPEGGKLPSQIAGVWKAQGEDMKWEVRFDRYGNIDQAVHHMTGAQIKPNTTTVKPLAQIKGQEVYNCGTWTMEYLPKSRSLTITMKIDYLTEDCPAVVEGTMDEILKGTFNEDFTEWNVDWYNDSVLEMTEPVSGNTVKTDTPEDKKYRGKLLFKKMQ